MEPDHYRPMEIITARIVGHRDGRAVDFTKTYINPARGYENPVDYVGRMSEDGEVIAGMWSLFEMNGTFEMRREASVDTHEEAEAVETVSASS